MRLVKVAKALNMTGQQLRHELESVDFGVKPTDREIPDNLAQGIVRFIARKHKLDIDIEALFGVSDLADDEAEAGDEAEEEVAEEDDDEEVDQEEVAETPTDDAAKVRAIAAKAAGPIKKRTKTPKTEVKTGDDANVNLLRKLTLEDVSQEAIAKEQQKLEQQKPTKKEREAAEEERRREAKVEREAKQKATHADQEQIKQKQGTVLIPDPVTVKEFAEKTGVQVPKLMQALMNNGLLVTITQSIDYDTAAIVAAELGVEVQKEEGTADVEHLHTRNLEELLKDEPENLVERAPVVVVMGHVDHGKTSILDAIRETDVVAGEAGGITQHIGAYQVTHKSGGDDEAHPITFLDTPGHEAFTAMRARGAQVTDIAIIVVAANEGMKPTTIEAIHHAKEANVPMIVALNKMDIEGADPDRVKGELAAEDLQPEDWGGNTPVVPCSAKTGQGIDDLLDHVVLLAQMKEFKGNPNRTAVGTVIESHLDASLGPLATVIVNTGTLRQGEAFICGNTVGKVRAMMEAHGQRLEDIGPSGAVRVSGFGSVPEVGDILQVVRSEQEARNLLDEFQKLEAAQNKRSFADLVSRLSEGKLTQLKIVLKTDTQGSLEALQEALAKKTTDKVSVKVIHGAVGAVSENDVMMAAASDGIVVAFHSAVSTGVLRTAEREGVEVREYDVVYAFLDDVDGLLQGLVEPEEEEKIMGHLEVKEVFMTKKSEQIIGGRVTDGIVKRLTFRLQRDGEEVGSGRITSLKKVDKDVKEIKEGTDCGMKVETSELIAEGDVLEVYLRELKRKG